MNTQQGLSQLDVQEFDIDVLDSGEVSAEAPTTVLCSVVVSVIIIAIIASECQGCVVAG